MNGAGDTIFAVAAGGARSALTVMRVSGAKAGACLDALAGERPPPRRAKLVRLRGENGETLDRALAIWFPGPGSYTGEDSAELHLHGGRAVADAVAGALVAANARPAEPGEFTRRAFLNGRMDLLEAEAVADLVAAETDTQRRQALRQLEGESGRVYAGWASRLTALLAQQEALIDFPDEDLPPAVAAEAQTELNALRAEITAHLDDGRRGELIRDGLVFAITGPPNVGKSSLVNRLAGRDVAIVSATPGTTRDVIETGLVLGGVKVTLLDTAGLRDTADPVEAEGVRRARARADEADLVVRVVDASFDAELDAARPGLVVRNKCDLVDEAAYGDAGSGSLLDDVVAVSAMTGAGISALQARLTAEAIRLTETRGIIPITRARHRAALVEATRALADASRAVEAELRAEDLRLAVRALGRITGRVGVEDILDSVFRQFCIGK